MCADALEALYSLALGALRNLSPPKSEEVRGRDSESHNP